MTDPYMQLVLSSPKVDGVFGTQERFKHWYARVEFWKHVRDQPEPDTLPPEYKLDMGAVNAAIRVAERLAMVNFERMLGAPPRDT